ncbi:MAG: glutamate synthase large subunit, partial [Verrucomicrobiae bacterium]|nr:glutamate synthase large subunit [Verrucomicrobiae bacterium]
YQSASRIAIPMILATGAVHSHLVGQGLRTFCSITVRSAECLDTHYFAVLIGVGATCVNAYLAQDVIADRHARGLYGDMTLGECVLNYKKAVEAGLLKIISKMGISVLNSYQGAQIFEAIGLGKKLMDKCFAGTPSQLEGVGFSHIAAQTLVRHRAAYSEAVPDEGPLKLDDPGYNRYRRDGETHSIGGADVLKPFHAFV